MHCRMLNSIPSRYHGMAVVTAKNVFRHCKMLGKRVRGGPASAENH